MARRTYEPTPQVPSESLERYRTILRVLSGELSVSTAARNLSISRNHFQTLMHRGLKGLIEGIARRPSGRPAQSARQRQMEQQVEQLTRENRRLQRRVETIERLLQVAGELMKDRSSPRSRPRRTRGVKDPEEADEEERRERLESALGMIRRGVSRALSAAVAGISLSTLDRWFRRKRQGEPLARRRGPRRATGVCGEKRALVESLVRQLHGLAGAAALAHSVPGVSRRQAAAIKQQALSAMERERKDACRYLEVVYPGIFRGFDQLQLRTSDGPWFALISGDLAVPYRTSFIVTRSYTGAAVADAVERDFALAGNPLVWRADRARMHETDEVTEVLRRYNVLALHGPPRYPQYYGSLERQNREHRAWLEPLGILDPDRLESVCSRMVAALNGLWPRRRLGYQTATEAFHAQQPSAFDRQGFLSEVTERAASLSRRLDARARSADLAKRLAIEQTLKKHGLLRQYQGSGAR